MMTKKIVTLAALAIALLTGCADHGFLSLNKVESRPNILLASDLKWEQLNPARGDKSPKAATLWGSRTGPGPAGFLLKPIDGFKSPPHIHNTAYRGVVISGLIHNDHPSEKMNWMSTGSFWTQPEGGVHITAAKGNDALAYIEVEERFGVLPASKAFASENKAVNLSAVSLEWVEVQPGSTTTPKVAHLWGNYAGNQQGGALVAIPAGNSNSIRTYGSILRAVVIQGVSCISTHNGRECEDVSPGSYFSIQRHSSNGLRCGSQQDCLVYVRTSRKFDVY